MSKGFIYILVNPAMPGMVKVGKTTRSAKERATELSSVTGIPSPFMVVYEQPVKDSNAVEKWVHIELDRRGYRVADNREFFSAPIHEIVSLIILGKDVGEQLGDDGFIENDGDSAEDLAANLMELADAHLYGTDGCLKNPKKALELYRQAAKLGNCYAMQSAGRLLMDGDEGVKPDYLAAIEYLKNAIAIGPEWMWDNNLFLAEIFSEHSQSESAAKHWEEALKFMNENTSAYSVSRLWRYCYDIATGKVIGDVNEAAIGRHGPLLITEIELAHDRGLISDRDFIRTKDFIVHCVGRSWE